jgi:hypothetical protein
MTLKFGINSISPVRPFLTIDEISNCILDIPQNINMELKDNVLTLKSGSVLTWGGDTYTTYTTTVDQTQSYQQARDGSYVIFAARTSGAMGQLRRIENIGSGAELPEDGTQYSVFYTTTDKLFHLWNSNTSTWSDNWTVAYPLGIIEVNNGVASFAKDANGNDMIFNGAGFIGHHAFVLPGVQGLKPNGFNLDGSLASNLWINDTLQILELVSYCKNIMIRITAITARNYFPDITKVPDSAGLATAYDIEKNQMYYRSNSSSDWTDEKGNYLNLVDYVYSNGVVTDFTIRQPVKKFYQL